MPLPTSLDSSVQALGKATQFAEDIHAIINQAPFFDELENSEIQYLCEFMDCYTIHRGRLLIREGDTGDFLLIILTGTVDVVKEREDGGRRIIATVGPGATVGEMAIIDNGVRFASCISNEQVDFAVLDRDSLNAILHKYPHLGNKVLLMLLALMTKRLRETGIRLVPHLGDVIV
jgi:CRP/FNR family transcriptional regulator, cyclic AMP receptor protein